MLEALLEGRSQETKLSILRNAYTPERVDVAERLIEELSKNMCSEEIELELRELIETQINIANASGYSERAKNLKIQYITAHFYSDEIERLAKESNDPEIIDAVISNYKGECWHKGHMIMNLLELLGRKEEAVAYALEAIDALDAERQSSKKNGGILVTHGVDDFCVRIGLYDKAVDVLVDNEEFEKAVKLAQKYLSEKKLSPLYKKIYNLADNMRSETRFDVKIAMAELLKDENLIVCAKRGYLDWFVNETEEPGCIGLAREIGTKEQLRTLHERVVAFYEKGWFIGTGFGRSQRIELKVEDLAKAAEEAYTDLSDLKYARVAMDAYNKITDFTNALKYARIIGDQEKIAFFESALSLVSN